MNQNLKNKGNQNLESFINNLKDENREIRLHTARKLNEVGNEQAIEALMLSALDADLEICCWSIRALGIIGSEKAVPLLIELYENENPRVRRNVVNALGKIGGTKVENFLLKALKDPVPFVSQHAAEHLKQYKNLNVLNALLQALTYSHRVGCHAADSIISIGATEIFDSLINYLHHFSPSVRANTVRILASVKHASVVELLIPCLKDTDKSVRFWTAYNLYYIGDKRALPNLEWLVENEPNNYKTRRFANLAIKRIREELQSEDADNRN
jgi:HEAT repeat protein